MELLGGMGGEEEIRIANLEWVLLREGISGFEKFRSNGRLLMSDFRYNFRNYK